EPGCVGRFGDYRVLRVLGTGGMGVLLRGEECTLRRLGALKLMGPHISARPGGKERILLEARAGAAVQHPRVGVIYKVDEVNGIPYIAMPLMKGQSLSARVKAESRLPLVEAIRFTREAAEGLSAAHIRGLTHGDVKPGNIWLEDSPDGVHIRLLD